MPKAKRLLFCISFALTLAAAQDARQILTQAFDNDARLEKEREQYLYKEHAERWSARQPGPPKLSYTRDYEYVYLEGRPYRRLVAMDGKPLSAKRAQEEAQRMEQSAAERRAHVDKRRPISFCDVERPDILRLGEQALLRRDTLNGRPVFVIKSTPQTSGTATNAAASFEHTFWIDQEDLVVAQERCEAIQDTKVLRGSWRMLTSSKEEDRPWMIRTMQGEFFTPDTDHWTQKHTFFGHKRFSSISTIVTADPEP